MGQIISVFARKTFQIDDPTIITKALFHIDYDDGYIAYLNGVEFSRRNMGAPNTEVYYNETTTGLHEAEIYTGGFPEEISIDLNEFPFVSGDNTLAVEVHNYSTTSSDLSCIQYLTLGYNSEIENPKEQHQLMELVLGRDYWYQNSHPRLRATHGLLFFKEMNFEVFLNQARMLEKLVEGKMFI